MKIWKSFLPDEQSLSHISDIVPGSYFFDTRSSPRSSVIYLAQKNGAWLSISWDYFDVEFKFEVYGISVKHSLDVGEDVIEAGVIPRFSQIKFLIRTEWTRPTDMHEVPDGFEQIIEENGPQSRIPGTAISVATTLYGVVFSGDNEGDAMMIAIDDASSYSLRSSTDPVQICAMEDSCDLLTLPEILDWKPRD